MARERLRVDGWRLFCERMDFPPFVLWKDYPSFERLLRALELTEQAAFAPAEFLRTVNHPEFLRLRGRPPLTQLGPMGRPEGWAKALEKAYCEHVALHGGQFPSCAPGHSDWSDKAEVLALPTANQQ